MKKYKVTTLLKIIGEDARDVFSSLTWEGADEATKIKSGLKIKSGPKIKSGLTSVASQWSAARAPPNSR